MGPFEAALKDFSVKVGRLENRTLRIAILEVRTRLIIRSPVKTGRFRGNWFYGVDVAPVTATQRVDPAGGATLARIEAAIPEQAWGHRHYIVNNLPYAWFLENGGSKQAPEGMVRITTLEWDGIVAEAAEAAKLQEGA